MFALHKQLAKDCIQWGRSELCECLLLNDANYPWFILVPRVEEITEIYQLPAEHRARLEQESHEFSLALADHFAPSKLNIAALGNMVSQLHIHHIVRYKDDAAWPAPVWGYQQAVNYTAEQLLNLELFREKLFKSGWFKEMD